MKSTILYVVSACMLMLSLILIGARFRSIEKRSYPVYTVWQKLHPTTALTYDEWVLAQKFYLLPDEPVIFRP